MDRNDFPAQDTGRVRTEYNVEYHLYRRDDGKERWIEFVGGKPWLMPSDKKWAQEGQL